MWRGYIDTKRSSSVYKYGYKRYKYINSDSSSTRCQEAWVYSTTISSFLSLSSTASPGCPLPAPKTESILPFQADLPLSHRLLTAFLNPKFMFIPRICFSLLAAKDDRNSSKVGIVGIVGRFPRESCSCGSCRCGMFGIEGRWGS